MRRRVEHGQLGREFSLMCSIVICLRSQTHAAGLGRARRAVCSATTTSPSSLRDCATGSRRRAVHSFIRDNHGRLVPGVRPKFWQAASVKRSRDRADYIARARKQRKTWLATTQWMNEVDRRGICELETTGIEWRAVERWLDALDPREAFVSRMFVKQVLQ